MGGHSNSHTNFTKSEYKADLECHFDFLVILLFQTSAETQTMGMAHIHICGANYGL